ncbi:MAG: aminotransferase class V-fold PLP-dependent enzyme [Reichenbachiella sp.]|uniref:aminotransferase class V-fold PLP-dependent enzyme n=1 Tax=Reichenbachiella sp. TaxID=2184521 RepID=UPI0029672E2D|nr:aminotransferase class V-fold PLP-dependent enzyme [Reichenbachiella sp.]MDW3208510.1 aminotransferase class V-fold PLP-dependent enzyme [Reichenbachiella sp.]
MNCQRKKFNLNKKFAYLNCAYMAPLLKKVEKAGIEGIKAKRQPNKVSGEDFFKDAETLRILYSDLINNPEPNRIVMIPSVSYGIGNVVNNIPVGKGENIVLTDGQFPSNVYPWKNHCDKHGADLILVAAPDTEEQRGKKWNEEILKAITQKTKAVSLGHVHWADGTLFDLKTIRKKCDEVGAALIIDGTQSIGALPFDIQEIKPDALIVAGYKWLLGPYTSGLAYYGPRFDQGEPIEQNWINRLHSDDFANLVNYQDEYMEGALRYGMGQQSNFIANPMLIASIKEIRKWGVENIQQYCQDLIQSPLHEVKQLGLYVEDSSARSAHLFGIKFPKEKMENLATALKVNRVSVSIRGEFIRVSPHVYNDERDMKKLIQALKATL